ncbi:hypothetical protein HZC21_02220, partial [Candidatus Peregrinibacteria bacterium]|nr:hypothetical protein [Candidatus Peregrinibacteria bacterium]
STKLQQQAQEVQNLPPSVPPAQNRIFVRLLLAPKNELKLKELQKKLSREQKALVDLNEVIGILLDAYEKRENSATVKLVKTTELEIKPMLDLQCAPVQSAMPHKPTLISENSKSVITKPVAEPAKPTPPSRHIPTKNKKILAWPECVKLPKIFHHTLRFSLNPSHDPNYLVPLCKNHEQLAHHGLIENEELQPENWRLKFEPDKNALKYQIDKKVISHYAPQ